MGIKVDIKRKLGEFSLDIHFQTETNRDSGSIWLWKKHDA